MPTDTPDETRLRPDMVGRGRGMGTGAGKPKTTDRTISFRVVEADLDYAARRSARGEGGASAFIRLLMAVARALGLSREEWEAILRDPARFRQALRDALATPPE